MDELLVSDEYAALAVMGSTAIHVMKIITTSNADDNILLNFISIPPAFYARLAISVIIAITNVTILITRLEKSMATNIITAIATIVQMVMSTFFQIV